VTAFIALMVLAVVAILFVAYDAHLAARDRLRDEWQRDPAPWWVPRD